MAPPAADTPRREFGIQYEDPCGTGSSEGAMDRDTWSRRVIDYARHTGQNLLAYPLAWYHGPQYPSDVEPSQDFDTVVAPDRRQYVRWTSQPADWVTPLLDRLHEAGMEFQGNLTLLRLGSLMQQMNIDQEAVEGGAETINNVRAHRRRSGRNHGLDDDLQRAELPCGARQRQALRRRRGGLGPTASARGRGTSPAPSSTHCTRPCKKQSSGSWGEIAGKYGHHPAFSGVGINMWAPTITWFGFDPLRLR